MQFLRRQPTEPTNTPSPNAAEPVGECGQRLAHFRVHWIWPGTDGAFFPLACHADSPTLDLNVDYVGPLCPEEVNLLRDPKGDLNPAWTFEITPLDG